MGARRFTAGGKDSLDSLLDFVVRIGRKRDRGTKGRGWAVGLVRTEDGRVLHA